MITLTEESLIVGGVDRKIDKIAEKVFDLLNDRLSNAVDDEQYRTLDEQVWDYYYYYYGSY